MVKNVFTINIRFFAKNVVERVFVNIILKELIALDVKKA